MPKPLNRTCTAGDRWKAAEAALRKAATKPAGPAPEKPFIPSAKEITTMRIDRDDLGFFQEDGPGWQDGINEALRKAAGK